MAYVLPLHSDFTSNALQLMVIFAGDMNGHVGSSNAGYDGTRGGFGYGSRNADGSRILEFADGLNLVICSTLFTKQEATSLHVTCRLTACTPGSAPGPTLGNEYGKTLPFYCYCC